MFDYTIETKRWFKGSQISEKVQVAHKRRNRHFLENEEEEWRRRTCSSLFQVGNSG